ncbi:hypothetical protein CQW23_28066 [Capsicum baccatum]|uniref:SWIM-type domain-containing protein n=1 Tax=Capsicum baccatum TaxID=33114 RepID=A0A2G2VFL7_CAPBA|nr:hypothetical protein CQW23_28066 [Capsicum baccatum]
MLQIEINDVWIVGIWAKGRVDKTIIAKAIVDTLSYQFKDTCFPMDVTENAKKSQLHSLQNILLYELLRKKDDYVKNKYDWKCMIPSRLCSMKVLIVLDEIDHSDHLEYLADDLSYFGDGIRFVVTTRNIDLIKNDDEIYEVSTLPDHEVMQLLNRYAFRKKFLDECFMKFSLEVVNHDKGLPLSLKLNSRMSIIEYVLVSSDFMREWEKTPSHWKWKSFTKVTLPIASRRNGSYDDLVVSIMESGDLDYMPSDMVISYLMHSREKVYLTIINNDRRVSLYMMDVGVDGVRPILRINIASNILGFEKGSRVHFPRNTYDMMTINITELLNPVLMDEREYPVSYIFNLVAKQIGEKFRDWHEFVSSSNNKFIPYEKNILRDNKSASDSLYVTNVNGDLDQFTVFVNSVTAKVNLLERSYSCRKYDLVKLSCEHAMAALQAKYGDGEGYGNSIYEYSSPIYKIETYLHAYSEAINIVPAESEWIVL